MFKQELREECEAVAIGNDVERIPWAYAVLEHLEHVDGPAPVGLIVTSG